MKSFDTLRKFLRKENTKKIVRLEFEFCGKKISKICEIRAKAKTDLKI